MAIHSESGITAKITVPKGLRKKWVRLLVDPQLILYANPRRPPQPLLFPPPHPPP